MVDIRINQLPAEASPVATDVVPIDGATVGGATRKTTIQDLVLIGRPTASQAEAEAGTNPTKVMTPLTTKQSIASEVGVSLASAAQGLLADTAAQKAQNLNDLADKGSARMNIKVPTYAANRAAAKALDTAKDVSVVLLESGREGLFKWNSANLSSFVTLDTVEALYIAPTADPTGAGGAWVRQRDNLDINILWGGAVVDAVCTSVLQALLPFNQPLYIPGRFLVDAAITKAGGIVHLKGDASSVSKLVWTSNTNGLSLGQVTPIQKLQVENLGILTRVASVTNKAVVATFTENSPYELDIIFLNNQVSGEEFDNHSWGAGLQATDCALTQICNNFIVGRRGATPAQIATSGYAISIVSTRLAIVQHITDNYAIYFKRGIDVHITGSPGVEGLFVTGNSCVQCTDAIVIISDFSGGYAGAQYTVSNNHCEFFNKGLVLTGLNEIFVAFNMLLAGVTTLASISIHITNCRYGPVFGNTMSDGNGGLNTALNGIWIDDSDWLNVRDNVADTPDYAVLFLNGSTNCTERDNKQKNASNKRFLDTSGGAANNVVPDINVKSAAYTANANLTTTIPEDNTKPQITEGTEILSVTITPKSAGSRILLQFKGWGTLSGLGTMIAALYRTGTSDALQVAAEVVPTGNYYKSLEFDFVDSPNTTSAVTYSVRVGPDGATTMRMNGSSSAARFGGASAATLVAQEINT